MAPQEDFKPDHMHRWPAGFCELTGMSETTAWREAKAGRGPKITKLTTRLKGVRHRDYLAWLQSRDEQNGEAA